MPWSVGGATKLRNLCSLCRRHHTRVHELGFRIEPDGEGGFRFFRADGVVVEAAAPPPTVGTNPVDDLREWQAAAGIEIDAETNFSEWDGRAVDYHHIVYCLVTRELNGVPQCLCAET